MTEEDEDDDHLGAKYSTKMDQQLGQGEPAQSSEDPDYENDDFEDMDDDFNLPKDHQQNDSQFGLPCLKEQIMQKKEEKSGPLFPHSLPPQYTSSATQASVSSTSRIQAQVLEEQKKMENARKPAQVVMQK